MPRPRRPRRLFRLRWWLLGGCVVVAVWAFLAYRQLDAAHRAAQSGLDRVTEAKRDLTVEDLLRGEGTAPLEAARDDFRRAADAAESPWLAPARFLPVAGRQVESVRALTRSAADVADAGLAAIDEARERVADDDLDGPERARVAAEIQQIATRLERRLDEVDLGPSEALVGPLADARSRFRTELSSARDGVARLDDAAAGSARFLTGPSRYLVFAANNGEMRAGSGMWLSAGLLTVTDGDFDMGDMVPTGDLRMPDGSVAITDADLAARWGWAGPNVEWRNLAMSPRFDASAALAADMWQARTGVPVDGVLALDPFALRALLEATGPVEVGGVMIDADNVIGYTLLDQYQQLAGEDLDADQLARREQLSGIARAALDALDRGGWDAATLVQSLRGAAEGRHILAWSRDPAEQLGWEAAGIGGQLPADSLMLSVLSEGGNKLDQFLALSADVTARPAPGRIDVEVAVTLVNETPAGLPVYVAGPSEVPGQPGRGVPEGVYAGIVTLNVPGAARDTGIAGDPPLVTAGGDGETSVLATRVVLGRGEATTLRFRFSVSPALTSVSVLPSARVPEVRWAFRGREFSDGREHRLRWS